MLHLPWTSILSSSPIRRILHREASILSDLHLMGRCFIQSSAGTRHGPVTPSHYHLRLRLVHILQALLDEALATLALYIRHTNVPRTASAPAVCSTVSLKSTQQTSTSDSMSAAKADAVTPKRRRPASMRYAATADKSTRQKRTPSKPVDVDVVPDTTAVPSVTAEKSSCLNEQVGKCKLVEKRGSSITQEVQVH